MAVSKVSFRVKIALIGCFNFYNSRFYVCDFSTGLDCIRFLVDLSMTFFVLFTTCPWNCVCVFLFCFFCFLCLCIYMHILCVSVCMHICIYILVFLYTYTCTLIFWDSW